VGKGFSGVEIPLFENMLAVRAVDAEHKVQVPTQNDVVQENVIEEVVAEVVSPTPTSPSPPSLVIPSSPPHQSPSPPQSQAAEGSSQLVQQVLEKCFALVLRVEGLENANAAQQVEILKLKAKVKKLERLNKVKSSKLRRLKKVGTSQRIELEVDQEKDAQVEGRQADTQAEIYNIDLDHSSKVAKRRKLNEEAQEANNLRRRLEIVLNEDDDVFVKAVSLAQKAPVVDYQVVVVDNRPKYKIIRADDTHQFYISFTTLQKNFDREDLEALWRIVKDRFFTKKPTNFSDKYLLLTLKTMFGELDEQ
nr:hypothetical protein [Tanacetum cinerariifolium]